MNLNPALRTGLMCLLLLCTCAARGQMYVWLALDPPTTAGAGIPAASGFNVASSKSGPGSFHLYAVDDVAGSFGIADFSVKLNGTFTSLINRSSQMGWYDVFDDSYDEGFSLLHSVSGANPVQAFQSRAGGKPLINGFGQAASNFAAKTPDAVQFFALSNITPGQWGNYADPNTKGSVVATGDFRNALFLAEGTYIGVPPTIDLLTPFLNNGTGVRYWTLDPETNPNATIAVATTVLDFNPFTVPEPGSMALICFVIVSFSEVGIRRRRNDDGLSGGAGQDG